MLMTFREVDENIADDNNNLTDTINQTVRNEKWKYIYSPGVLAQLDS